MHYLLQLYVIRNVPMETAPVLEYARARVGTKDTVVRLVSIIITTINSMLLKQIRLSRRSPENVCLCACKLPLVLIHKYSRLSLIWSPLGQSSFWPGCIKHQGAWVH